VERCRTRQQIWDDGDGTLGLDQLGNWGRTRLDITGDNDFTDSNEYDDDRTHNIYNELTGRDTDDNGTDDYTLDYDTLGNLTDDGANYEYVYDAFGRLREINNTSNQNLVAEYKYNALGYRISVHQDTDTDGDVDANDTWYHFAYDESWKLVATYREDDTDPKEMFVNHNAGLDGSGSSSYIDNVILRDRDANTSWVSASDGTLEERRYYCQNWRADVSVILASGGTLVEWVKYSPYGIPFGLPGADTDSDGDCDATDISNFDSVPSYDVRYDVDLDGDNDATDKAIAQTYYQGTTYGWDVLSSNPDTGTGNRKGYAGYEYHEAVSLYHIRNRVFHPELGRWTRRDPLGYVDGMSVYEYVKSCSLKLRDPFGFDDDDKTPWSPIEFVIEEANELEGDVKECLRDFRVAVAECIQTMSGRSMKKCVKSAIEAVEECLEPFGLELEDLIPSFTLGKIIPQPLLDCQDQCAVEWIEHTIRCSTKIGWWRKYSCTGEEYARLIECLACCATVTQTRPLEDAKYSCDEEVWGTEPRPYIRRKRYIYRPDDKWHKSDEIYYLN